MNPPNCVFWIVCDGNSKNHILFVTMATVIQGEEPFIHLHRIIRSNLRVAQNGRFIMNPVYGFEPSTRTIVSAEGEILDFRLFESPKMQ